jgi:hypothetical protein
MQPFPSLFIKTLDLLARTKSARKVRLKWVSVYYLQIASIFKQNFCRWIHICRLYLLHMLIEQKPTSGQR